MSNGCYKSPKGKEVSNVYDRFRDVGKERGIVQESVTLPFRQGEAVGVGVSGVAGNIHQGSWWEWIKQQRKW